MSPLLSGFVFGGGAGSGIVASGGTKTTDGNYSVHTFTTSGTFTVTANPNNEPFDILCVGGGGGGGLGRWNLFIGNAIGGSGGGSGGIIFDVRKLTAAAYTVTIGAGGNGGADSGGNINPTAGGSTSFDTLTATGGSFTNNYTANTASSSGNLSSGTSGQGAVSNTNANVNGGAASGTAFASFISGASVTYGGAGGGGAAGNSAGTGGASYGNGGAGGGYNDVAGTAGTGYGGGGGGGGIQYSSSGADKFGGFGGAGSGGVVIVRYRS